MSEEHPPSEMKSGSVRELTVCEHRMSMLFRTRWRAESATTLSNGSVRPELGMIRTVPDS